VLDAAGGADVVTIQASGVVFGKKKKGFTLANAAFDGLAVLNGLTGVTVTDNEAVGNQQGFDVGGSGGKISGNRSTRNTGAGFVIQGTGHTVTGNLAIGNNRYGILLAGTTDLHLSGNAVVGNDNSGIHVNPGITGVEINRNSILGNNAGGNNCGLEVDGSAVDATNNFWGAATGPGADPADRVCLTGGGSATVTPFAAREFKVRAP
jgi:parallel beta-helix repeat protein